MEGGGDERILLLKNGSAGISTVGFLLPIWANLPEMSWFYSMQ